MGSTCAVGSKGNALARTILHLHDRSSGNRHIDQDVLPMQSCAGTVNVKLRALSGRSQAVLRRTAARDGRRGSHCQCPHQTGRIWL
jgi:hypothetical protein